MAETQRSEQRFLPRYRTALKDRQQQENLLQFQRAWARDREAAFADQQFGELRTRLTAAKNQILDDLDGWLKRFEDAARANGATVTHARSARDACEQVLTICQQVGARHVIKSKSMVSEEIELNHFLAAHGGTAIESDLGEWLVQLAGERPSHMVLPFIHKNRRQAADLVRQATGSAPDHSDVPAVVHRARDAIREHFWSATVGLTGANALVVEDGSVLLVTNEGNADLTVTLPQVHIVLAGIEKIGATLIPTLADAAVQLRLLARSATAQRLTVYTTFIRRPPAHHRLHIILVDNGRRNMLADRRYRAALRCIRCGACADTCPPYQVVGGHVFGHIYSGAIGLVVTPAHHGLAADAGPQSLCVSCHACQTVCPVNIPLPQQILDRRSEVVASQGMPLTLRAMIEVWKRPSAFDRAMHAAALGSGPLRKAGNWVDLPAGMSSLPMLNAQASWRSFSAPAAQPFRELFLTRGRRQSDGRFDSALSGKRIALFAQCLTDRFWPEQAAAVTDVLRALGAEIVFPERQHCCGLPALDAGDYVSAREMACQTLEVLEATGADFIVSGASSCVALLKHDLLHLFEDVPVWRHRAERMGQRIHSFTQLIAEEAGLPHGIWDNGRHELVTYHDFCQSRHVLHELDAPRSILTALLGCQVVELPEVMCCGFGGARSGLYPEVSRAIGTRKWESIRQTGALTVVTDNPGCIAHLRSMLHRQRGPERVLHLAELVAERLV
ncbi:MAG: LUD domain-containing protein [Chloroflexi bacterium]|nr:LUD domain-containing protein [Chloroflexota bacterium]